MTYVRPTPAQRRLLAALVETGSLVAAADRVGISHTAAMSQMRRMRTRCGFASTEQAVYLGTRDGWLALRDFRQKSVGNRSQGVVRRR